MNEWNIESEEGWSAKLQELLQKAQTVGDTLDERMALSEQFVEFIINSHPNTDNIKRLDAIADKARKGVLLSAIEKRVAAISDRTGELALITKSFQETAAKAQAEARSIRLEKARGVVDSLEKTVKSIQVLSESLKGDDDVLLTQSLMDSVSTLTNLKTKVQEVSD